MWIVDVYRSCRQVYAPCWQTVQPCYTDPHQSTQCWTAKHRHCPSLITHTHTFNYSPSEPVPERQNQSGFYWSSSEWQWHQLGCMQVCTSLQTDNHASTPPLCFLQAGCPSCRPTNSVKALKAKISLRQSYNNAKVMINLRWTSNLHNILRWVQCFS